MNFSKLITSQEEKYQNSVKQVAEHISQNKNIRIILMAGPSCSGKTTTSHLLTSFLKQNYHINCFTVSIDDYYKDVIFQDGETINDKNFEALDSIDIPLLHYHLKALTKQSTVDIPLFDFHSMKRNGIRNTVTLKDNDVVIIEGLHALNPLIYDKIISEKYISRVFLDCFDPLLVLQDKKLPRLVRRLVRDNNYRNASAPLTFSLWQKVIDGEEKHIYPFLDNADFSINTYHSYEPFLFKKPIFSVISEISIPENYKNYIDLLSRYFENINTCITPDNIPKDSLLWEFVR